MHIRINPFHSAIPALIAGDHPFRLTFTSTNFHAVRDVVESTLRDLPLDTGAFLWSAYAVDYRPFRPVTPDPDSWTHALVQTPLDGYKPVNRDTIRFMPAGTTVVSHHYSRFEAESAAYRHGEQAYCHTSRSR